MTPQEQLDAKVQALGEQLEEIKTFANQHGLSFYLKGLDSSVEFVSHKQLVERIETDYLDGYYADEYNGAWLSSSDYC